MYACTLRCSATTSTGPYQAADAVDDGATLERQRHDEAAAVVRVLADKVDPPGRVPGADLFFMVVETFTQRIHMVSFQSWNTHVF